jgi:SAM-dependent methyltransferase
LAFQKSIEEETAFLKRMDRRYGIYKRCRSVTKVLPGPGKILDIGCATGLFLSGMQDRGWECLGIELNEQAATYARERMGCLGAPARSPAGPRKNLENNPPGGIAGAQPAES